MNGIDKERLKQLRNYAEWERNNREGPVGKLHVLDWAADEIETLRARVAELEAGGEVVGYLCTGSSVLVEHKVFAKSQGEAQQKMEEDHGFYTHETQPLYTAPQPVKVPEGYALVPLEPTEAMRNAFWRAHDRYENGIGEMPDSGWRAMLSAQEPAQ